MLPSVIGDNSQAQPVELESVQMQLESSGHRLFKRTRFLANATDGSDESPIVKKRTSSPGRFPKKVIVRKRLTDSSDRVFFLFFCEGSISPLVLTIRSGISARDRVSNHVAVVMRVIVLNVLFVGNKPITV